MVKEIKPLESINNDKKVEVFGSKLKRIAANQYRFAMNLPESLECSVAGDQYAEKVKADFHRSVSINGNKLTDIVAKDATKTTDATFIDQEVADCIKASAETSEVLAAYKEHINVINDLLKSDKDLKYNVFQIINAMHTLRSNTLEKLKIQQQQEITDLETKFTNQRFRNSIGNVYNISPVAPGQPDPAYDAVKKEYVNELKRKHSEQNKAFNDAIEKDLTKIHKESQKEVERISFLTSMYFSNKKTREEIDRLRAKNAPKNAPVTITGGVVDIDSQWATFRGIKPEDVQNLQSLHRDIVSKNAITRGADGSYSMKIPCGGWRVDLILFKKDVGGRAEEKIKDDMLALAEAVRASGFDTITTNITHKIREGNETEKAFDEAHANLLLRKAYEAAIQAGFKTKDITINLNGKTYKGAEIRAQFREHQTDLKIADDIAKQTKNIYEDLKTQHKNIKASEHNDFYQDAKQKLQDGRAKAGKASPLQTHEDLLDPHFQP